MTMTLPAPVLPDVLTPGMRVVFCGTAPGKASARAGAYYAGPGNRFWVTLHEVGLTPVFLRPAEFARLAEFGIGLTDISKTASGSDREVGRQGFDPVRLAAVVKEFGPAHLAFNGKNSARAVLGGASDGDRRVDPHPGGAGDGALAYGRQPDRISAAAVWVLPSTSGAARAFWDIGPWKDLARAATSP